MRRSQGKGARSCRLQAFPIACVTALIARLPSATAGSWREPVTRLDCSRGGTYVSQDPCISAVWPGRATPTGSISRLAGSPVMARAIVWPAAKPGRPCPRPLTQYGLARYNHSPGPVRSRHRRCLLGGTMQRTRAYVVNLRQTANGMLHNALCHRPAILRHNAMALGPS